MKDEFGYILKHKGKLSADTIDQLISDLEEKKETEGIRTSIFKKILTLIIEILENIYKYEERYRKESKDIPENYQPEFILSKSDGNFILTASNPVLNNDLNNIKDRLDYLSHIDKNHLKELYLNKIMDGHYTTEGGASLGFIKMMRVTKGNIDYGFHPIDEHQSYFYLRCILKDKEAKE